MQQIDCHLLLGMSEGTHVTIVASLYSSRVGLAELYFILFRMIEFLDTIVRP
jgi:hypothetical protein